MFVVNIWRKNCRSSDPHIFCGGENGNGRTAMDGRRHCKTVFGEGETEKGSGVSFTQSASSTIG